MLAQHWATVYGGPALGRGLRLCWEAELTASECYVTVLCHANSAEPALARRWQYSSVITAMSRC